MTGQQQATRELGFYFFLLVCTLSKHFPCQPGQMIPGGSPLELCKATARSYAFFDR